MKFSSIINKIYTFKSNQNFKAGLWYTIFSFFNNGISFLLLLLLAKYLMPFEYGKLNLFTTIINILSILISLCTNSYVSVAFFQKTFGVLRKIIVVSIITGTCITCLLSITILIFRTNLEILSGLNVKYLLISTLICYFQLFNNLNLDIWRLEEQPKKYGVYSLSFAIFNFVISFMLVTLVYHSWDGRVIGWLFVSICYFLISLVFLIKRRYLIFCFPNKQIFKETFFYSLPLVPHLISYWMKQGMDRFIINFYYDSSEVGFYSFAMNLATIITMVGTAFNSTNSVYIYKSLSKKKLSNNALERQCSIMSILFCIIGIFVIITSYLVITTILPEYHDCLPYILPLSIGAVFHCIYLLQVNFLFYYKKTVTLMWVSMGSAAIHFPLSLWLTKISCFYTSIISMSVSICTTLVILFIVRSILRKHTISI